MLKHPKHRNITFDDIDFSDPEILNKECYHHRRLPLMVTIADALTSTVDLQRLLEAGMNLMRFTASYQTGADRLKVLNNLRKAAAACCKKYHINNWPVATCIELKTTMAKAGIFEEVEDVNIAEGSNLIITRDIKYYNKCNAQRIFVDNLTNDVKVGDVICIGSDETEIICTEIIDEKTLRCVVAQGGTLKSLLNVCVKGNIPSGPNLTPSDLRRIQFALDNQVDVIQINHVRCGEPARMVKKFIGKEAKRPVLLTGICTQDGLECIDDVLKESDAIVLSRELLPLHLEIKFKHRFNNIQKWVAAKCQQAGKPLFLSGGVFFQALQTGNFDFFELADVANAILDGYTGLVLTNCLDIEYTLSVIYQLSALCTNIEPYTSTKTGFWNIAEQVPTPLNAAEAAAMSCAVLANQALARIIIVPTKTGRSAQALFRMRPSCLILAVCMSPKVARRLHLYKCVIPLLYSELGHIDDIDEMKIKFAIEVGLQMNWITYGDTYVTLQRGGESSSYCDTVRIITIRVGKKQLVTCSDEREAVDGEEVVNENTSMEKEQLKSKYKLFFS